MTKKQKLFFHNYFQQNQNLLKLVFWCLFAFLKVAFVLHRHKHEINKMT